ncbi:EpsG family protein [Pseudomonas sp. IT-P74]|uniref:EpsG family protein n=1 Tax=Pseudomonas sp. IT-P74 TaxID=3026445 RepID=UPI0039E0AE7E
MAGLELYGTPLYVISVFLLLLTAVRALVPDNRASNLFRTIEVFIVFLAIVLASYYISNRPFDMEGDTEVYINFYNDYNSGLENPFQTFEPGFIGVVSFFGFLGLSYQCFFFFVAFMFLWSYYFLLKAVFGSSSSWVLPAFGFLLFYPFFFSLTANIIRQGFALCFVNFSLVCCVKGYWRRGLVFSLLATLFHKSSLVYFPFVLFRRQIMGVGVFSVVVFWLLVSMASYFKVFSLLVSMLFELLSGYGLSINYTDVDNIDYLTGFRWDFWAFSSFSIVLLIVLKLLERGRTNETYIFYICAFLSCLHIAMFDVAYNDRFGIYAWIFYPLEIGYIIRLACASLAAGKRPKETGNENVFL